MLTSSAATVLGKEIYIGMHILRAFELMVGESRLEDAKALVDADSSLLEHKINYLDQTPLLVAAHQAQFDMVEYFLDKGAQPEASDFLGRNAAYFLTHWPEQVFSHPRLGTPNGPPTEAVLSAALNAKKDLTDEDPDPIYECYLAQGDLASATERLQDQHVICSLCRENGESLWITSTWALEMCDKCYKKEDIQEAVSKHAWFRITGIHTKPELSDNGNGSEECKLEIWHQGPSSRLQKALNLR